MYSYWTRPHQYLREEAAPAPDDARAGVVLQSRRRGAGTDRLERVRVLASELSASQRLVGEVAL